MTTGVSVVDLSVRRPSCSWWLILATYREPLGTNPSPSCAGKGCRLEEGGYSIYEFSVFKFSVYKFSVSSSPSTEPPKMFPYRTVLLLSFDADLKEKRPSVHLDTSLSLTFLAKHIPLASLVPSNYGLEKPNLP